MKRRGGTNIYLIGLMGSGKSTVGSSLSRLMDWKFIDIDAEIEREQGRSVSTIFKGRGEEYFRGLEERALRRVSRRVRQVIAVGGGAVLRADNRRVMKDSGVAVYLQLSPLAALRRLKKEGLAKRPLLAGKNSKEQFLALSRLLRRRRSLYLRSAQVRLRSGSGSADAIAGRALKKLAL